METVLKIRRLCLVEGKKISEVARRFQLSRTTVRKYLNDPGPPAYNQTHPRPNPQLGDFEAQLTTWLEQDLKRPKRAQRTAMRLALKLYGMAEALPEVLARWRGD